MYWLRERIHPTWHVTATTLGFLAGVTLALVWYAPGIPVVVAGIVLVTIALWRQRRMLIVLAFVGGGLLGLVRGSYALGDLAAYQQYFGQDVTVVGTVADDITLKSRGAHVSLRNVTINGQKMPGNVFATVTGADKAQRSDTIHMAGEMEGGFGGYAAKITGDAVRVERPVPGDVPLAVRDGFAGHIRQAISEPAASLGIGYLLGQKSALPNDLIEALKVAGLTHIVVASGYNLTILVRIGRRLFAKTSKYLAMISGVGLIVSFIAMTGLSPSMTRAGLVAGLGLWAWYFGRNFHPVTLLGVAAATTVVINPSYVWGDLGWLLSFAAFAGVMIIAPIVTAYFFGEGKAPFIGQLLIETVAAQIATLPIMIIAFQQLSVIAPLANLLILPLIPFIMLIVALAGGVQMLLPVLGSGIGWVAEQLLNLQIAIVNWCATIPWALTQPMWAWWGAVLYIGVVFAVVAHMKHQARYKLYTASIVE